MIEIYNYINENTYEFFGVVFSILYVCLSIKQNILCWPALIIAALFNMYAYFLINLPLQSIMQVFFVGTAVYGWWSWDKKNKNKHLNVSSWKKEQHFKWLLTGLITTILITLLIISLTKLDLIYSQYPFSDSLIFVFNIIPMYMTGKKILECWIYFIIIDIYSGIFFYCSEAYFFSFLFFCYIGFATYGYFTWKKECYE